LLDHGVPVLAFWGGGVRAGTDATGTYI
jgi:hypothetical protein